MEKEHGEDHGSLGSDAQLMQEKSEFRVLVENLVDFGKNKENQDLTKLKKKIYRNKM